MRIIDAHMHLPTHPKALIDKRKVFLEELSENEIEKALVISDSCRISEIGTLTECAELFENIDNVYVVGGISPLYNNQEQMKILEKYLFNGKIIGIKLYCGHEHFYLNDEMLLPIISLAEKYAVPVLFHSGWDNAKYSSPSIIKDVALKYFNIKFVCCHCCYPNLKECFVTLADCKNVYFDISSVADENNIHIKRAVEEAVYSMPNRIIFGSDYNCCSQKEHINFAKGLNISKFDMERLMFRNAINIYNL